MGVKYVWSLGKVVVATDVNSILKWSIGKVVVVDKFVGGGGQSIVPHIVAAFKEINR